MLKDPWGYYSLLNGLCCARFVLVQGHCFLLAQAWYSTTLRGSTDSEEVSSPGAPWYFGDRRALVPMHIRYDGVTWLCRNIGSTLVMFVQQCLFWLCPTFPLPCGLGSVLESKAVMPCETRATACVPVWKKISVVLWRLKDRTKCLHTNQQHGVYCAGSLGHLLYTRRDIL